MGCFTEPRVLRSAGGDEVPRSEITHPAPPAANSKRLHGVSNIVNLSAGSCSSWYDNKPVMLPSPQSVQNLDRSSNCSDHSDKTSSSSLKSRSVTGSSRSILHESVAGSSSHDARSLGRDQPRVFSAPIKIGEYSNDYGLAESSGRSERHFSAPLKTSHSGLLYYPGVSPPSIVDDAEATASGSRRASKTSSPAAALHDAAAAGATSGYDTDQCSDRSRASSRLHGSLRRTESFGGRPRPLPLPHPTGEPVSLPAVPKAPVAASVVISRSSSESRHLSGSCSFVSTSSCCGSGSKSGAASIVPGHRATTSTVDGIRSWSMSGRVMPIGGLHAAAYQLPQPLPHPSVATKMLCPSLKAFAIQDLADATADFSPDRCIDRSDQGAAYTAWIKAESRLQVDHEAGQIHVAVVRLSAADELKGFEEWRSEVQLLSQLQDRNLCRLRGYCVRESNAESELGENLQSTRSERLLVFEQSPNGNLHDHLFGTLQHITELDWTTRIKIALGAARGLLYIHDRAPLQVVYRDFRASSILLDKDFKAKLAGYGLGVSNCCTDKDISSSLTKAVKISRAYAKCNVWSFGVVLLELFTGKHSKDAAFLHDEKTFVNWAKPFLLRDESRRTVCPIIDSRLSAATAPLDKGAQQNLSCLLLRCLKKDAKLRPSMTQVVEELKLIRSSCPLYDKN